jgi:hypothetical protein
MHENILFLTSILLYKTIYFYLPGLEMLDILIHSLSVSTFALFLLKYTISVYAKCKFISINFVSLTKVLGLLSLGSGEVFFFLV